MKLNMSLKQIVLSIGIIMLLISLVLGYLFYNKYKTAQTNYEISMNNNKAYIAENSTLNAKKIVMDLTIDQLNYYSDSLTDRLNKVRKELSIKDKDIQSLQYYKENFGKVDTIKLSQDTIFVKNLNIDTTIIDSFYTCNIKLRYPNILSVAPNFINEKMIFVSSKKETINPPKKLWICRIFQKKHIVLTIDVIDNNPYMKTDKTRFIKIIN